MCRTVAETMSEANLKHQLSSLVDDFGYDNVHKTLGTIKHPRPKPAKSAASRIKSNVTRASKRKPDAFAVVNALNLADCAKREFLLHLASDYENKQFMPNVNHVRSFLMNDHKDPSRIKSRQQVTGKIFKKLAAMDLAVLREIDESSIYGPPKRLATYAEAIGNFGRAVRASP